MIAECNKFEGREKVNGHSDTGMMVLEASDVVHLELEKSLLEIANFNDINFIPDFFSFWLLSGLFQIMPHTLNLIGPCVKN